MKYILALFLLINTFSYSQRPVLFIPAHYPESSIDWWENWAKHRTEVTSLPPVYKTNDSLHFRLTGLNQTIDIWTNDYKIFYGKIASYIYSKSQGHPLFKNLISIDTAMAKSIYNIFASNNAFDIPNQDYYGYSGVCLDCIGYKLEHSTADGYSLREYTSVSLNNTQFTIMNKVIKEVLSLTIVKDAWDNLKNNLPCGCYSYGSMAIMCIKSNPEE